MDILATIALTLATSMASDMEPGGPMCRANGQWYQQGEIACIQPPCMQPQLSRCGMVLNNSAWRKIQDGCPISSIPLDEPAAMASIRMSFADSAPACLE